MTGTGAIQGGTDASRGGTSASRGGAGAGCGGAGRGGTDEAARQLIKGSPIRWIELQQK